ncbi:MAG: hypothetical protein WC565_07265 [Parcubacteria group bacterium]|jgi:hypothetical protein
MNALYAELDRRQARIEELEKRLRLFEATGVEDALARLGEPALDNDGGPGDIDEAIGDILANSRVLVEENCAARERIEELERALGFLVDAAETEPGMAIYQAHIEQAKSLLRKTEATDLRYATEVIVDK